MALSGSFNTSGYEGRYLTFSWTATQDIATNTSTISWTLKGAGTGEAGYYMSGPFKVVIAGAEVYTNSGRIELYNGTLVASGTKKLTHDTAGKKSFSASVEAAIWSASVNCKGSGSWTLNNIPRKATVSTAPNFNDEENPKITYSNPAGNSVTSLQACIALSDGSTIVVPYRDINKLGASYTFSLTTEERTALRKATPKSNTLTVRFYIKTVIGGANYYHYIAKTLTITHGDPTLSPSAEDVNTTTLALTGDRNVFIKGYSNVAFKTNATALKNSTIASQSVVCGSKSATTATGTLVGVDSNIVTFTATDSRGNTTTQTKTYTLVNYVDLTCNMEVITPTTGGEASVSLSGKCFNSTFGTAVNTLILQYRYKTNDGSYGSWVNVTPTRSGNNYSIVIPITGLNYLNSYTFQARAQDKLKTVATPEKKVKTVPIFDWGEDDFNFNVPVAITDNTGSYNLLGLAKAMTTAYSLTTTATPGANYTAATGSATLIGNILRVNFTATRAKAATGNITNEEVVSLDIQTGGKINAFYNTSFCSGGTGPTATFATGGSTQSDSLTLTINLAAIGPGNLTQTNAYFSLPVKINLDAY